jgi:hypothetical protein
MKKSKNQTHRSKIHQKKSKNKVTGALGLSVWLDLGRPNLGQPWLELVAVGLHRGSADPWCRPTAGLSIAGHQFHPQLDWVYVSSFLVGLRFFQPWVCVSSFSVGLHFFLLFFFSFFSSLSSALGMESVVAKLIF